MTQTPLEIPASPRQAVAVPPLPARLLGTAGLLPSAGALAVVLFAPPDWLNAAFVLDMLYAAMILSFLGGAWWGLVTAAGLRGGALTPWLVAGVVPCLVAWPCVYFLSPVSLAVIAAFFPACLLVDRWLVRHGHAPAWWWVLRWPLSAGMGVLNLAIAVAVWPR